VHACKHCTNNLSVPCIKHDLHEVLSTCACLLPQQQPVGLCSGLQSPGRQGEPSAAFAVLYSLFSFTYSTPTSVTLSPGTNQTHYQQPGCKPAWQIQLVGLSYACSCRWLCTAGSQNDPAGSHALPPRRPGCCHQTLHELHTVQTTALANADGTPVSTKSMQQASSGTDCVRQKATRQETTPLLSTTLLRQQCCLCRLCPSGKQATVEGALSCLTVLCCESKVYSVAAKVPQCQLP
jgi:hypothetical protein